MVWYRNWSFAFQRSFSCHKIVLASRSHVFDAMLFHGNPNESVDGKLVLDYDGSIVEQFLTFLYTDQVDLDAHRAAKLLAIADEYSVQKLKATCSHFLTEQERSSPSFFRKCIY
jgi:hypothetical protein